MMSKNIKEKEFKKALSSFRMKVTYQKNKVDLSSTGIKGLKADRVIARIVWPKSTKELDFKKAEEFVTKIIGKEMTMLSAYLPAKVYGAEHKKHSLFVSAWAKDSKKAIEKLIAQVQQKESSFSNQIASYTKHNDLVSYFMFDASKSGDMILSVAKFLGKNVQAIEDALGKSGDHALIQNVSRHDGLNYEADLQFSASMVKFIGRMLELNLK